MESSKENCLQTKITSQARKSKDINKCDELGQWSKSCKLEVALTVWIETENLEKCDELEDWDVVVCKNQISLILATNLTDISKCDFITAIDELDTENFLKEQCETLVNNLILGQ